MGRRHHLNVPHLGNRDAWVFVGDVQNPSCWLVWSGVMLCFLYICENHPIGVNILGMGVSHIFFDIPHHPTNPSDGLHEYSTTLPLCPSHLQPTTLSGVFTPDLVTFGAAVAACEAAVISDKYGDLIQRIIQLTWAAWLVHMLSISIYLGYLDVLCAASKDVVFVQIPGCLFSLWNTHFTTARLVDNGTWRCTSWRKRRPPWMLGGRNGEMLALGQAMGSL